MSTRRPIPSCPSRGSLPTSTSRARARRSRSSSPRRRTSSSTCATSISTPRIANLNKLLVNTNSASRPSTPRNSHSAAPACCRSSRPSSTSCRWTSWARTAPRCSPSCAQSNQRLAAILDDPALKTLPGNTDATVLQAKKLIEDPEPCQLDRAHAAHAGAARPHHRRRRVRPVDDAGKHAPDLRKPARSHRERQALSVRRDSRRAAAAGQRGPMMPLRCLSAAISASRVAAALLVLALRVRLARGPRRSSRRICCRPRRPRRPPRRRDRSTLKVGTIAVGGAVSRQVAGLPRGRPEVRIGFLQRVLRLAFGDADRRRGDLARRRGHLQGSFAGVAPMPTAISCSRALSASSTAIIATTAKPAAVLDRQVLPHRQPRPIGRAGLADRTEATRGAVEPQPGRAGGGAQHRMVRDACRSFAASSRPSSSRPDEARRLQNSGGGSLQHIGNRSTDGRATRGRLCRRVRPSRRPSLCRC